MFPTPSAIVFDLDGTLVDTAPDLAAALNAVLAEHHRAPLPVTAVRNMIGDGTAKMVERGFTASGGAPEALDPAVARFLQVYAQGVADRSTVYPGVAGALTRLADAGCRLAVCTNKPDALAEKLLTTLGLRALFHTVVGGDVPFRKPDARHLLTTLERLEVPPAEAVMVGDAGNDVAAARAAGLPVILVPYGYTPVPPADLGGDAVLGAFDDLPGLLGIA